MEPNMPDGLLNEDGSRLFVNWQLTLEEFVANLEKMKQEQSHDNRKRE